MVSGVVGHIHEAGVRRRWHPQDEFRHAQREGGLQRLAAPNVHNSLAIQKKHVGNMYRSWRSLNSHAHGPLDTDLYARHIPVGRVCAERTFRAPLTETELGNMYAGSFVFGPGPCTYGTAWRNTWCSHLGPKMGHAPRKCMTAGADHPQLPHAKRRDGESPGPGAYATGDSAVMGRRRGTFAASDERKGAATALESATSRLKTLEWRIGHIRRGIREPETLRPGQVLVVKIQSGRELARVEAKASYLRAEVNRLAELTAAAAAKSDPLPGVAFSGPAGSGEAVAGSHRRPMTTEGVIAERAKRQACGQGVNRFYHPLASTATFYDSPGPGTYSLAKDEDGLGRGSLRRSPSFDLMQRRVVGEKATAGRSLASLHLHSTGGGCCSDKRNGEGLTPFHAYMCEMGPGQYTPDMCAPPLLSQAGRRRHRNQSSSLDCCC